MIFTESVRSATSLANRGDFQSAIEALGELWPGVGSEPPRSGRSDLEYADLLLACGILSVEAGRFTTRCLGDAKNLLSKAARLFDGDAGRYESLFWLATAYLWSGENHEALALVDSILSDQQADSYVEFCAGRLKGLAHMNLGNAAQAEASFSAVELFLDTVPPMARGKFYLNRGMLFRQTRRFGESLDDHRSAIAAFKLADSVRFQAAARNNIAVVYTEQGRFAEARAEAEAALRVFVELRDRPHQAKVWDQLAQIYGREENYVEMCRCADRAVEILSDGDHEGWLAEALITQGAARARLGMVQAQEALSRALAICEKHGDPKQADAVTMAMWEIVCCEKDFQTVMQRGVAPLERTVYERVLEKHNGRVSPAAHQLGLHHKPFQKRLRNRFPDLLPKARWRRRKPLMRTAGSAS